MKSRDIGWVLPRVMLLLFVVDLLLRLAPIDPLTFRAWEAMLRHYPNAEGPFEPNKRYHRDRSYGGAASIGNLPERRHYHPADFTTDAFGYHNPPELSGGTPAGIVVGDSYTVGGEVAEDQTLPAQLTRLTGGFFFNAGAPQPIPLQSIRAVAQRLGLRRGVVVFEFLEARALEKPPALTPDGARGWGQSLFFRALGPANADRWRTPLNRLHDSPFQVLAAKLQKRLQNDSWLPNGFAKYVIQERLRNGEAIVFLPLEFRTVREPDTAAKNWTRYFLWLSGELRKDGLDFLVLLAPNRSTVYGPMLLRPREMTQERTLLRAFERRLREAGVPVVNLTPAYQSAAEALFPRGVYLYQLDDTHWDRCGIAIAAAEIQAHIREESRVDGERKAAPVREAACGADGAAPR